MPVGERGEWPKYPERVEGVIRGAHEAGLMATVKRIELNELSTPPGDLSAVVGVWDGDAGQMVYTRVTVVQPK